MDLPFYKYHGTGNDFILIDERKTSFAAALDTGVIARLCHRHFGIGADGFMRLQESEETDFRMLYYNADGNESSLCGNGSRCIVAFARKLGIIDDYTTFETSDGQHEAWILPQGHVRLRMHSPQGFQEYDRSNFFLDTGSPHHIRMLGGASVESVEIVPEGRAIRNDSRYAPGGTNANFVNVESPLSLRVRTYERGVENETLSCGTGVTASAYLHLMLEKITDGQVAVETPGGLLTVEVHGRGTEDEEVFLIGPATFVFEGRIKV